jgi:hypothetical protein
LLIEKSLQNSPFAFELEKYAYGNVGFSTRGYVLVARYSKPACSTAILPHKMMIIKIYTSIQSNTKFIM